MTNSRILKGSGVAVAAALLSFACGGGGGGGTGGGNKGTINIGVEMPLSGTEGSQGVPIENGVRYAVQKAGGSINGFTLKVVPYDDAVNGTHDPQKGAQNVTAMVGDSTILGFVGPLNSSVAQTEIPIAADAHMAMISPANTNPCLTKDVQALTNASCAGHAEQLRKGNPNNYFRVVTTDDWQGPAMADYFYKTLKITKVGLGSDNQTYGKGIADSFQAEWKTLGGTVVGQREDYDPQNTHDFKSWLNAEKAGGAQGIYVGGVTSTNVCAVRAQMQGIFDVSTPFGGGDGIVQDGECVKAMGSMSTNVFASLASVDPQHVASAKATIDGYKKAYPNPSDYTGYAIVSVDAGGILISAIGKAINDAGGKMPTREQVRAEVAKTKNYQGALGTTTFDSFGDTNQKVISIYEYTSSDPTTAGDQPWHSSVNYATTPPTITTG